MSFFYDFLNSINLKELSDDLMISIVVGKGISIIGDIKLVSMSESDIEFLYKKQLIKIQGSELKINSLAKGEFVSTGKIQSFKVEELNEK